MDVWGELVWTAPDLAPGPPPVVRFLIIERYVSRPPAFGVRRFALLAIGTAAFLATEMVVATVSFLALVAGIAYLF